MVAPNMNSPGRQIPNGSCPVIQAPFKPFTLDEVCAITGCTRKVLDYWVGRIFNLSTGSGVWGLNYMQTFGVFVGCKYLHEGADDHRATCVAYYLANINIDHMFEHFNKGNTWPVPSNLYPESKIPQPGMMVRAPRSPMGMRLKLDVLYEEFKHNLNRLYPNG